MRTRRGRSSSAGSRLAAWSRLIGCPSSSAATIISMIRLRSDRMVISIYSTPPFRALTAQPSTASRRANFLRHGAWVGSNRDDSVRSTSKRGYVVERGSSRVGSFEKTRCPWFISRLNETLALASSSSGMVGRFHEGPIQAQSTDDSALASLLFRLRHEPAGCWLKWSGQSA